MLSNHHCQAKEMTSVFVKKIRKQLVLILEQIQLKKTLCNHFGLFLKYHLQKIKHKISNESDKKVIDSFLKNLGNKKTINYSLRQMHHNATKLITFINDISYHDKQKYTNSTKQVISEAKTPPRSESNLESVPEKLLPKSLDMADTDIDSDANQKKIDLYSYERLPKTPPRTPSRTPSRTPPRTPPRIDSIIKTEPDYTYSNKQIPRLCKNCKIKPATHLHRHCSKQCYREYMTKNPIVWCKNCKRNHPTLNHSYCSKQCYHEFSVKYAKFSKK